ncbi:MAG: phage integrase N-terminal SAM-like domain-containing protein [Cyanobacteria bacterium REEB459]|nr:phage integrase N-terminal SAM-like domain-containing protein [Cyanobacteria bacterium REEB459]
MAEAYSYPTQQAYAQWIRCYILFQYRRHPNELGVAEIETLLTHLAVLRVPGRFYAKSGLKHVTVFV